MDKTDKDKIAEKYKLNKRQQHFCEIYLTTENGTEAYMLAYEQDDYDSASVGASRNLSKDKIQSYIQERKKQMAKAPTIATPEDVLKELTQIAYDMDANHGSRLKALELLGKTHALFVDRQQINQVNDFEINLINDAQDYIDMPSEQLEYTDANFEENEEE